MIRSMTGFGRARQESEAINITVEIRSVNSRYLDVSVRAPREYACLEQKIRQLIQQTSASRGKVEVSVQVEKKKGDVTAVRLDRDLCAGYLAAIREMRDIFGLTDDITVMKLAENRDLFRYDTSDASDETEKWNTLLPVLSEAAAAFVKMREAEGASLQADILQKLENVKNWKEKVAVLSEADKAHYHDKLEERLRQALGDQRITVDEQRLLTECAIFADRVAVDEELARLSSHFTAFHRILESNEPAGRKLDFLMQEMNRETNTIGSKCSNAEIAQIVVNMKCELEKIREQIQNIE